MEIIILVYPIEGHPVERAFARLHERHEIQNSGTCTNFEWSIPWPIDFCLERRCEWRHIVSRIIQLRGLSLDFVRLTSEAG